MCCWLFELESFTSSVSRSDLFEVCVRLTELEWFLEFWVCRCPDFDEGADRFFLFYRTMHVAIGEETGAARHEQHEKRGEDQSGNFFECFHGSAVYRDSPQESNLDLPPTKWGYPCSSASLGKDST